MPDYQTTVEKLRKARTLPTFGIELCGDAASGLSNCRLRFPKHEEIWCQNCRREVDRDDAMQAALALLTQQDAELARLRGARRIHELDNHHNAAACPYCRPTLEAEQKELARLRAENAELREYADNKDKELARAYALSAQEPTS